MDPAKVLQENARVMQLRESTIYGMAIDPDENYIVACSDFGHIFIHSVDGDMTKSKTLQAEYAPFNSLHFTCLNGVSVVLCGGTRWICCWKWEDLLNCPEQVSPEPIQVFNCMQNFRMPAAAHHQAAADVNSIDSDCRNASIYAGCGDGVVYHLDCQTGQTLKSFVGHDSFIHKIKSVGEASQSSPKVISCDDVGNVIQWDPRNGQAYGKCNMQERLNKLNPSKFGNQRLWCASLDVDESENFLYAGGGVESASGTASLGWSSVCHLGAEGSGLRALCATSLPCPVQELALQGDYVVCGGAQGSIRYLSATSLDVASSTAVSPLSVFSLAVAKNSVKQLLAVGGTHPIVDLISMHGSRPISFFPRSAMVQ